MNYILKPKNRKLKTKFLYLTSKFRFGGVYLSKEKKYCLLSLGILVGSFFFPWFEVFSLDNTPRTLWIFSGFTGIVFPLIGFVIAVCLFLMFSHVQKEKIRGYILSGQNDGQIIMILAIILMFILLDIKAFATLTFEQFAPGSPPETLSGYVIAFMGTILLYISGDLMLRKEKKDIKEISYIDRSNQNDLMEYQEILDPSLSKGSDGTDETKKKNMRLPI